MKPLVRWTIGPVHKNGYDCLSKSISLWKKTFHEKFDLVICHNQQNQEQINFLKKLNVKLICQENFERSIEKKPFDTFWKVYPPRINIKTHEIFIDNDIIVFKEFDLLDEFLKRKDLIVCTEGYKRFYGNFSHLIKSKININTGFFCLPPFFDFKKEMQFLFKTCGNIKIEKHEDDQGVIMAIFQNYNLKTISYDLISICNPSLNFNPYKIGKNGIHFTGLNTGLNQYWNKFNSFKLI